MYFICISVFIWPLLIIEIIIRKNNIVEEE